MSLATKALGWRCGYVATLLKGGRLISPKTNMQHSNPRDLGQIRGFSPPNLDNVGDFGGACLAEDQKKVGLET